MAKEKSSILNVKIHKLGIGGTLAKFDRTGRPPVTIKWRAGKLRGAGRGQASERSRGPGGRRGRLRGKSAPGFRFKVTF